MQPRRVTLCSCVDYLLSFSFLSLETACSDIGDCSAYGDFPLRWHPSWSTMLSIRPHNNETRTFKRWEEFGMCVGLWLCLNVLEQPSAGPRELTFTWWGCCGLYFLHKPTELAHSFLFCSCVYFCLYGPFNGISFHKFSRQLSTFFLHSSTLISSSLVLWTMCLFMKVSFGPDIILCGWLGLKHQLTN